MPNQNTREVCKFWFQLNSIIFTRWLFHYRPVDCLFNHCHFIFCYLCECIKDLVSAGFIVPADHFVYYSSMSAWIHNTILTFRSNKLTQKPVWHMILLPQIKHALQSSSDGGLIKDEDRLKLPVIIFDVSHRHLVVKAINPFSDLKLVKHIWWYSDSWLSIRDDNLRF